MALTVQIVPDSHLQNDGRRRVLEIFSDAQGEVRRRTYLGLDSDDRNAIAQAKAISLLEAFADAEFYSAIYMDVAPSFRFQTATEFLGRLRQIYRDADPELVVKIARWVRNTIIAGDVTQTQLRNAFGLTQPQWDTLRTKMEGFASSLDSVEMAQGE